MGGITAALKMKSLSLFITGFLTYTGSAQAAQEPIEIEPIVPELEPMEENVA